MYYMIEANIEVGDVKSQNIMAYESLNDALIAFHQSVAYAMSNENVLKMGRSIINDAMMPVRTENWARPEPEPEPNEEPDSNE